MSGPSGSLRGQLLRWLLIPLSILFLLDASGSYFLATRLADRVLDTELLEIARELALHVKPDGPALAFDLEKDAERTLLLDPHDTLTYSVQDGRGARIAGDAEFAQVAASGAGTSFRDATQGGVVVRVAELNVLAAGEPVSIQVASTKDGSAALAREIVVDIIVPQLVLILIAGALVWFGVARGLLPLRNLQQAVAARSHRDLSPVTARDIPGEVPPLIGVDQRSPRGGWTRC